MVAVWTSLPDLLDELDTDEPAPDGLAALLEVIASSRPAWHARAACADAGADLALFFPERQDPTGPARALCGSCPVADDCLAEALRYSERDCPGIWGGTSARERRQLRQDARTAA